MYKYVNDILNVICELNFITLSINSKHVIILEDFRLKLIYLRLRYLANILFFL